MRLAKAAGRGAMAITPKVTLHGTVTPGISVSAGQSMIARILIYAASPTRVWISDGHYHLHSLLTYVVLGAISGSLLF